MAAINFQNLVTRVTTESSIRKIERIDPNKFSKSVLQISDQQSRDKNYEKSIEYIRTYIASLQAKLNSLIEELNATYELFLESTLTRRADTKDTAKDLNRIRNVQDVYTCSVTDPNRVDPFGVQITPYSRDVYNYNYNPLYASRSLDLSNYSDLSKDNTTSIARTYYTTEDQLHHELGASAFASLQYLWGWDLDRINATYATTKEDFIDKEGVLHVPPGDPRARTADGRRVPGVTEDESLKFAPGSPDPNKLQVNVTALQANRDVFGPNDVENKRETIISLDASGSDPMAGWITKYAHSGAMFDFVNDGKRVNIVQDKTTGLLPKFEGLNQWGIDSNTLHEGKSTFNFGNSFTYTPYEMYTNPDDPNSGLIDATNARATARPVRTTHSSYAFDPELVNATFDSGSANPFSTGELEILGNASLVNWSSDPSFDPLVESSGIHNINSITGNLYATTPTDKVLSVGFPNQGGVNDGTTATIKTPNYDLTEFDTVNMSSVNYYFVEGNIPGHGSNCIHPAVVIDVNPGISGYPLPALAGADNHAADGGHSYWEPLGNGVTNSLSQPDSNRHMNHIASNVSGLATQSLSYTYTPQYSGGPNGSEWLVDNMFMKARGWSAGEMISPPMDLSNYERAFLQFSDRVNSDNLDDRQEVWYSTDYNESTGIATNWKKLSSQSQTVGPGIDASKEWRDNNLEIDLSCMTPAEKSNIRVMFLFDTQNSKSNLGKDGWNIDDVKIVGDKKIETDFYYYRQNLDSMFVEGDGSGASAYQLITNTLSLMAPGTGNPQITEAGNIFSNSAITNTITPSTNLPLTLTYATNGAPTLTGSATSTTFTMDSTKTPESHDTIPAPNVDPNNSGAGNQFYGYVTSNVMDLSSTAFPTATKAKLSFTAQSGTALNMEDLLNKREIQVSTNNGASWVTLSSQNIKTLPGGAYSIDILPGATQTMVRFRASTDVINNNQAGDFWSVSGIEVQMLDNANNVVPPVFPAPPLPLITTLTTGPTNLHVSSTSTSFTFDAPVGSPENHTPIDGIFEYTVETNNINLSGYPGGGKLTFTHDGSPLAFSVPDNKRKIQYFDSGTWKDIADYSIDYVTGNVTINLPQTFNSKIRFLGRVDSNKTTTVMTNPGNPPTIPPTYTSSTTGSIDYNRPGAFWNASNIKIEGLPQPDTTDTYKREVESISYNLPSEGVLTFDSSGVDPTGAADVRREIFYSVNGGAYMPLTTVTSGTTTVSTTLPAGTIKLKYVAEIDASSGTSVNAQANLWNISNFKIELPKSDGYNINEKNNVDRPNISFDPRRTNIEGRYTLNNNRVQIYSTDYVAFSNTLLTYIEQNPDVYNQSKQDTYAIWNGETTDYPSEIFDVITKGKKKANTSVYLADSLQRMYSHNVSNGPITGMYVDDALAINMGLLTKTPTLTDINNNDTGWVNYDASPGRNWFPYISGTKYEEAGGYKNMSIWGKKSFYIDTPTPPSSYSVSMSVDDDAYLYVNGYLVPTNEWVGWHNSSYQSWYTNASSGYAKWFNDYKNWYNTYIKPHNGNIPFPNIIPFDNSIYYTSFPPVVDFDLHNPNFPAGFTLPNPPDLNDITFYTPKPTAPYIGPNNNTRDFNIAPYLKGKNDPETGGFNTIAFKATEDAGASHVSLSDSGLYNLSTNNTWAVKVQPTGYDGTLTYTTTGGVSVNPMARPLDNGQIIDLFKTEIPKRHSISLNFSNIDENNVGILSEIKEIEVNVRGESIIQTFGTSTFNSNNRTSDGKMITQLVSGYINGVKQVGLEDAQRIEPPNTAPPANQLNYMTDVNGKALVNLYIDSTKDMVNDATPLIKVRYLEDTDQNGRIEGAEATTYKEKYIGMQDLRENNTVVAGQPYNPKSESADISLATQGVSNRYEKSGNNILSDIDAQKADQIYSNYLTVGKGRTGGSAAKSEDVNPLTSKLRSILDNTEYQELLKFGLLDNIYLAATSSTQRGDQITGKLILDWDWRRRRVAVTQGSFSAIYKA